MKVEAATFARLRRLAPVLDDMLSAGEVEHTDQAVGLESLVRRYLHQRKRYPTKTP
jgi:hypothetical protein